MACLRGFGNGDSGTWVSTIGALETLHGELDERNQSAADSLAEGLDETLTLHRLGVYGMLGRSLKTTNCLESVNALVEERCAKVDHWQSSSFAGLMDARSGATAIARGETVTTNGGPCAALVGRAAVSGVTPTTNRSARSCGKTRTGT